LRAVTLDDDALMCEILAARGHVRRGDHPKGDREEGRGSEFSGMRGRAGEARPGSGPARTEAGSLNPED
jgi:hypothetical protein